MCSRNNTRRIPNSFGMVNYKIKIYIKINRDDPFYFGKFLMFPMKIKVLT